MKLRLRHFYLNQPLASGCTVPLPEDLQHRLLHVLRLKAGDQIAVFNGQHGLFAGRLTDAKAKILSLEEQLQPFTAPQPLKLALAIPKREAWETALRQATELGVTEIFPLITQFAQVNKINQPRVQGLLVEAAEQSERVTLPLLHPVQHLADFLTTLKEPCAWAYERQAVPTPPVQASLLLVGPEGGFAENEVTNLQNHAQVKPFSLGSGILRVDTAVVAALAVLCL